MLQVGWGRFGDDEEAFAACILMPGLLDIHGSDSTNYSVPLLFDFDGFFPLPRGILLTVSLMFQEKKMGACIERS